jgi:orotidine-5'-phosphate decarboxylase
VRAGRDYLALAADIPLPEAVALYRRLSVHVGWVKVGLSLFVEHGPKAVAELRQTGASIFLDLKLHDIPNTVELASARAGALGVGLLTVHASGGADMLKAAVRGARAGAAEGGFEPPRVLAVTVLTSLSDSDVEAVGWSGSTEAAALRLARLAHAAGTDGIVCSPREARGVRQAFGSGFFICTPGIRAKGDAASDQARTETAHDAVAAGADLLVVGRPLHAAPDPAAVAESLEREVSAALAPGTARSP